MDRGRITYRHSAVTLIELLIAISISSLLGSATVLMLRSGLDAYLFGEEQALIQKILDETLEEISGESFKNYGIRDALQIQEAKEDSLSFSCLWIDDSQRVSSVSQPIFLNRPIKLGTPLPILEFRTSDKENFMPCPITFIPHEEGSGAKNKDRIVLNKPLPVNSQLKIIFEPDSRNYPDVIMNLKWDSKTGVFLRTYKNKTELVPKDKFKGFRLTKTKLQYFDNTNSQIPAPVSAKLLSSISAVRLSLFLEPEGKSKSYQASTFISLRNSRTFGKGIIIRPGLQMKISNSRQIRTFSLGNIVGVKQGDVIQLLAQPKQGDAWRITIRLGIKDKLPIIEKYSIDYPPGLTVYSETINLTLDLPLNFLTIGSNGRYDYDFDKDVGNVVDLKGDVFLNVEKMTAQGAALFIRP